MALQRHLKIVDYDTSDENIDAALKVAFATTDMKHVNQHFGSAESFAIFAVDMERASLLEALQFDLPEHSGEEDKLAVKLESLEGCIAVYSQAIGASALGQLKSRGIQPVKVSSGTSIPELLESLRGELAAGPAAWLARAIESQRTFNPDRFDEMEAEGWDE